MYKNIDFHIKALHTHLLRMTFGRYWKCGDVTELHGLIKH